MLWIRGDYVRFEDEFGEMWVVRAGNPANKLLKPFKRLGLDYVVLPEVCYKYGKDQQLDEVTLPPLLTEGEAVDVRRSYRLHDCVQILKEG